MNINTLRLIIMVVQISKETDVTVTPTDNAVFFDDAEDTELSTYKSGNKQINEINKEVTSTLNTLPVDVRDEENEIFTEATVTSPPLTTVINGFVLPLTVRNFFKRPTFNPVQDIGIETVRTSENKQIENVSEKGTTHAENVKVSENNTETDATTETFSDGTTESFFNMPTTQPMKLFVEEDTESEIKIVVNKETLKPVEEQSRTESAEADIITDMFATSTENTVTHIIFEKLDAFKDMSTDSTVDITTLYWAEDNTTAMLFSNKIDEINIAQNTINGTETITTIENTEQSSQDLFTTESAEVSTTVIENNSKKELEGSDEQTGLIEKTNDTVSDRMDIRKEEKRPASTSPVSDLLNGIYRLISVRQFIFTFDLKQHNILLL
jgi:hypothetical protein